MGGLRLKIAPLSYVSLQYGLLKNELGYKWSQGKRVTNEEIAIDKKVFVADVTVNF